MGLLNHTLCTHHVQNEDRFPEQLPRLAAPTSNPQTTQGPEGFRPMKHPRELPVHSTVIPPMVVSICVACQDHNPVIGLHFMPSQVGALHNAGCNPHAVRTPHVSTPCLRRHQHAASAGQNIHPLATRLVTNAYACRSTQQSNTQQTPRQTPHQPWMPSCSA
jgi:hypothetical protein